MNWTRGDGGLCGNAVDLARWTRLLATGRVITPRSYRLMTAPTRLMAGRGGATDPDAYGLSFEVGEGPARELRLHMGAMHWYGTRVP